MPCLPHRQSVLGKQQNYSVAFLELPVAQRLDGKNLHLDTAKLIKPEKHATDFSKMTPSRYNVEQGRHTTTLNKTSSFLLSSWQACRQKLQQFFLEQQAKRGTAPGSDGTPTLFPKLIDRVQSVSDFQLAIGIQPANAFGQVAQVQQETIQKKGGAESRLTT